MKEREREMKKGEGCGAETQAISILGSIGDTEIKMKVGFLNGGLWLS